MLSPPFSGSTALARILETSENVSNFSFEGQIIPGAKPLIQPHIWQEVTKPKWSIIKFFWHLKWDLSKPILMEKSPPNIVWADQLQTRFKPSFFIVSNRNPYAFSEGFRRRGKGTIEDAAKFWLKCARWQQKNIKKLKNVVHTSYEEFVEDPEKLKLQLIEMLPELRKMDFSQSVKAKKIDGEQSSILKNYNDIKINELSKDDIKIVSTALGKNKELVKYFKYNIL